MDKSTLNAVSGVASRDVWAVGQAEDFASLKSTTLTMRWTGGIAWKLVPSPNPGGSDRPNGLSDVVAVSSNDVWAVGGAGYPQRSMILRWNGSAWNVVPNACGVPLEGVTAISASDVWAVGSSTICRHGLGGWRVVPSPQPRPEYYEIAYQLQDVSGSSHRDIWAVGSRVIQFGEHPTHSSLIEHWDGQRWSLAPHPGVQSLFGVKAVAANDAWAVGTDGTRQVILHWDGTSWSPVPTPNPGPAG